MRWLTVSLSMFLIFFRSSLVLGQQKDFYDFALQLDSNYQVDLRNFLGENRLTVNDLQDAQADYKNYDEFLAYLFQLKPQLFDNFVLIHDTGSIQFASQTRPRVVIFGEGLILAFAENPNTSYRNVEIIEFDDERHEFIFHELRFAHENIEFEKNPKSCQACHGSPLKPIWDPYDFWPGVYGSAIARLGSDQEKNAYELLRLSNSNLGIFSYLKLPDVKNERLLGIEALTQYVTQLQLIVMMKQWQTFQQRLDPFIYVIIGILNQCTYSTEEESLLRAMTDFFPESFHNILQQHVYASYSDTVKTRTEFKNYLVQRYETIFPGHQKIFNIDQNRLGNESITASQMSTIFEFLNIPYSHQMMSQGQNPFFLSVPGNINADFLTSLIFYDPNLIIELQPKKAKTPDSNFNWLSFDCQDLKSRSVRALAHIEPEINEAASKAIPSSFGQCIHCHAMNHQMVQAPYIPFDRTSLLRQWLIEDNYAGLAKIQNRIHLNGPGRMPPFKSLTAEEKASFEEALQVLIKDEG
ncbi:MAG: hypothetical protein ACOH5I_09245 [Oligoflexus sp.]